MKRTYITLVIAALVALTSALPANALTQTEQTRLQTIVSRGDQEIDRRIKALSASMKAINATAKLSSADKQTLTTEVTNATNGLTALKTTLDGATTLATARMAAQSIVTDYRVYALALPKVRLVKVADGQIALAGKFDALSAQFLQRFAELKAAGKDTSTLEATLSNMNTKTAAAKTAATSAQAKLIALQPTDYNSDHTILSGYRDQLKAARSQLTGARQDAKTIVDGIRALTK